VPWHSAWHNIAGLAVPMHGTPGRTYTFEIRGQPMKSKMIPLLVVLSIAASFAAHIARADETRHQRDKRMAWWREAKFGMFIHWGLYAIPAGTWNGKEIDNPGEWIMYHAQIPPDQYQPLVNDFNPVKFNAGEWAAIAKEAGMRYITITSKHHDGFALFDSQVSDYDIMATPFKRDIMKELADATRKQGMQICWYHSILDWHNYDYLPRGDGSKRPWDTRPTNGASLDRYVTYMKGQLKELLVNYGPIGVLWFDGGWEHTPEELRSNEVVAMIRGLQPDIIINDRIRIPQDFDTPEQKIPETGVPGRDWETCMTMNDTWGFKQQDSNWKSTETLLRNLIDIVSKGGNYLLNVGPKADGTIPEESVTRLKEIGRWLDHNGEAIYGTTASVFPHLDWGRCTVKPGKLYLHVFDWPAQDTLVVPGLKNTVKRAYMLADPSHAEFRTEKTETGWNVSLGPQMPDLIATVIVLEIEGTPEVSPTI
jgi:alpha-L-fucosidase